MFTAIALGASMAASAASQFGKGGGVQTTQDRVYDARGLRERMMDREVESINRLQTDLMANALGQFSNMAPNLWAAMGIMPVYEENDQLGQLQQDRDYWKQQEYDLLDRKKALKESGAGPKKMKWIQNQIKKTRKQAQLSEEQFNQAQAMPKRITEFRPATPDEIPADSPYSSHNPRNQITSLTDEALIRALKGEEPLDQSMVNRWRDQETEVRNSLRRRLGPDYENSSIGIETLAQFEEDKEEAFSNYQRDTVLAYSSLSQANAKLFDEQMSAYLERGTYLPQTQMQMASELSAPVSQFEAALNRRQEGRRLETTQTQKEQSTGSRILESAASGLAGAGTSPAISSALSSGVSKVGGWLGFGGGGKSALTEGFQPYISSTGETKVLETPTGKIIR